MTDTEMKTYEIEFTDGQMKRITVPATYKVSFGAIVPSSAKSAAQGYVGGGWGLRIWEATDKQRAVFTGVAAFRDLSIPILVAAVRKFGTETWHIDDGSWNGKKADQVEKKWVNAEEATALPIVEPGDSAQDDWGNHARPLMGMKTR